MPIVSQSRTTPLVVPPGQFYIAGQKVSTDWPQQAQHPGSSQSTTSFRGSAADDYERESGREILQGLRSEYKLRFDRGHEFFTQRKFVEEPNEHFNVQFQISGVTHRYTGSIHPSLGGTLQQYSDAGLPSVSTINTDGRRLISFTAPTKPEVSLSQTLLELRQKLPDLLGYQTYRRGLHADNIGHEYLNVEFGWKPLISDVQKAARAVADAQKVISQFTKDSDKPIRRKAHLDDSVTTVQLSRQTVGTLRIAREQGVARQGSMFRSFDSTNDTLMHVFDTTRQETWFSGAYSYHLAEADTALRKLEAYEQQLNHLLGLRITPEVIWELTPWSWLIDWFGDFGTFVSNVTRFTNDSLVLRYGYVMHKTTATRERYVPLLPAVGASSNSQGTYSKSHVVTKQRHRATPYGFGLSVPSFTGRQWSILGALGLTKSPNSIRYLD